MYNFFFYQSHLLMYLIFYFFYRKSAQVKKQKYRFNYTTRRYIIFASHCDPPRNISQETGLLQR